MMKNIIITGAGGYLGTSLIQQLLAETDFSVVAMTSQPEALQKKYKNKTKIVCCGNESLLNGNLPVKNAEALIHLAFSRRFAPDYAIAESIAFSRHVFESTRNSHIEKLIYVSSQGVYGNTADLRTVGKTRIEPAGLYALAKYATEQVLWAAFKGDERTRVVSVRLDSIAGNQKMLPAFVQQAVEKHHISVVGGKQIFSFMDVRDAAGGLIALLNTAPENWKPIYNLGPNNRRYTIMDLAELTASVAEERGFGRVSISLKQQEIRQYAGMDASDFMADTAWAPKYDMRAVISKLFDEYLERHTNNL